MPFGGWPAEALEFFEGLEADNSKTYWQRNKAVYESVVRAPMEELLAELAPEWGEGRVFRPYRDIRFSADKSPYKTHMGAMIGQGYVQLSAEGLAADAGCGRCRPSNSNATGRPWWTTSRDARSSASCRRRERAAWRSWATGC